MYRRICLCAVVARVFVWCVAALAQSPRTESLSRRSPRSLSCSKTTIWSPSRLAPEDRKAEQEAVAKLRT